MLFRSEELVVQTNQKREENIAVKYRREENLCPTNSSKPPIPKKQTREQKIRVDQNLLLESKSLKTTKQKYK